MKAQHYLKQIDHLETLIQNKMIEKEQWRDIALGITAKYEGERVQSSGNNKKMSEALDRVVDIEREIDRIIDQKIDTRLEVIRTIELLKPNEYRVLHLIYIQGKSFKEVASICDKSHSWATSVHGAALSNLQKILDSREQMYKVV